jgi:HEAT repeat protein
MDTISKVFAAVVGVTVFQPMIVQPVQAQSLSQRIASAPDGRVQFNYASRESACGDGRTFMRVQYGTSSNEMYGNWSNGASNQPCERGPVRVVLEQAARTVVGIRVNVGPLSPVDGATDLGRVSARDAADYLLGLAARGEGSVASSAIMPAMLADSVNNQTALLAIARDQSRSRETRRSAISWLGRSTGSATAVAQPLLAIVNDETDNKQVRQSALSTLSRLEGGAGIPEVIRLAGDREGGWVAQTALQSLASSGDPRSRQFLRDVVRRAELPDDALATAVRSLGQQYATAADVTMIREAYPRLTGPKAQSAALSAIAEFGGAANSQFLLQVARDPAVSQGTRQSALRSAVRSGARVADLIGMYNATVDYQMKDAIINALVESGDREATDKLLSIARADDSINARRKAINALGRSSDPRVKRELEAIADKR